MTKLTPVRKEILSVIEHAEVPVNVSAIMNSLASGPNISTVYRALDYFERNQYIHTISLSGIRFYYGSSHGGHGHFLFCRECRELIKFDDCIVHSLQKKLQKQYQYQPSRSQPSVQHSRVAITNPPPQYTYPERVFAVVLSQQIE